MKAICILNDPKLLADHQQSRAVLFEDRYPLSVGKPYIVLGMSIAERALCFLVQDDNGYPTFAPAGFFECFIDKLPEWWLFSLDPGIHASGTDLWEVVSVATWGYPEMVNDVGYIQSLLEFDSDAMEVFQRYLDRAQELQ